MWWRWGCEQLEIVKWQTFDDNERESSEMRRKKQSQNDRDTDTNYTIEHSQLQFDWWRQQIFSLCLWDYLKDSELLFWRLTTIQRITFTIYTSRNDVKSRLKREKLFPFRGSCCFWRHVKTAKNEIKCISVFLFRYLRRRVF